MRRPLLAVAAAILAALALPVVALAARDDAITGVEIFATPTDGAFVGAASGSLPGLWYANVAHTPLAASAAITGGVIDLSTTGGQLVVGDFAGGTVTQTAGLTGCANQQFRVLGSLDHVGVSGASRTGTGQFAATLTHYRTAILGRCVTYSASVAGTVSLSF